MSIWQILATALVSIVLLLIGYLRLTKNKRRKREINFWPEWLNKPYLSHEDLTHLRKLALDWETCAVPKILGKDWRKKYEDLKMYGHINSLGTMFGVHLDGMWSDSKAGYPIDEEREKALEVIKNLEYIRVHNKIPVQETLVKS